MRDDYCVKHGRVTHDLEGCAYCANERLRAAIREIRQASNGAEFIEAMEKARALTEREKKCECSLAIKLVGDGCSVCNPSYATWEDEGGAI